MTRHLTRWAVVAVLAATTVAAAWADATGKWTWTTNFQGNEVKLIDTVAMGFVYSAYLLCYTICMMPGGWFIDRFGPWAALLGLGLGSTAFIALTGLVGWVATTPFMLLAGLLVARSQHIHPRSI